MKRKRKKKRAVSSQRKRMTRSARLRSAVSWLSQYDGKNVLRGYCKHYGVDWRGAAIEPRRLGVTIDEESLRRRAESERRLDMARRKGKESQAATKANSDWPPYDSAFEGYLAGDYATLHAIEQENSACDYS